MTLIAIALIAIAENMDPGEITEGDWPIPVIVLLVLTFIGDLRRAVD